MLSDVCLSDVRLTSVAYIRSAGGVCGQPAGWRVLADQARLGLAQGCRCALPLQAWAGHIVATAYVFVSGFAKVRQFYHLSTGA